MFNISSNIKFKDLIVSSSRKNYPLVYYSCSIPEDYDYSTLINHLSPSELIILAKLKGTNKINNFLAGRYLSKLAISKLLSLDDLSTISIEKGLFNFPVVKTSTNESVQVSITYCHGLISVIAFLEECPMAIDLEKVCDKKVSSIEKVLSFPIPCPHGFDPKAFKTSQWTCLEALGKILKIGISLPFSFYEPKSSIVVNRELITTFKFLHPFKCSSFYIDDCILTFSYGSNCTLLHNFI